MNASNHHPHARPLSTPVATTAAPPMTAGDEAPAGTVGASEAICPMCDGSGRAPFGEGVCPNCQGTGGIIVGIGFA